MNVFPRSPSSRMFALGLATFSLLAGAAPAWSAPVNINTADAQAIAQGLKGIGLKRAQAIVDYRAKHGAFRSADELAQVKGLGAKVIQKNRADIRVDGRPPAAPVAGRPATAATRH